MKFLTDKKAMEFMGNFESVFKNAPHLPKSIVNFLVSIAPWFAGIGGVFSLYGGMANLFFNNRNRIAASLSAIAGINPTYFTFAGIFSVLTGILLLMAFTPLRSKKLTGWMYIFWVNIINLVQGLIGLLMGIGGILGVLIVSAIGFYFIFELKPAYKK